MPCDGDVLIVWTAVLYIRLIVFLMRMQKLNDKLTDLEYYVDVYLFRSNLISNFLVD